MRLINSNFLDRSVAPTLLLPLLAAWVTDRNGTHFPGAVAFQIPHAGHHHPLYVRYRQEQLEKQQQHRTCSQTSTGTVSHGSPETEQASLSLSVIEKGSNVQQRITIPIEEATISTPVSYDEETGMVQTAVRAIVQHPISTLVDNSMVGLSSTLVITTGALHEVIHAVELEWTHHATSSTESLAIISLGHFLHYGREAIRQLAEYHEDKREETSG